MAVFACFQPYQIAGIFEFMGAMVLGGETTKTVASDIANMNNFADSPDVRAALSGFAC